MDTIPYDATRNSLYAPGSANDFFQYGSRQIESEEACCAEMARLAYVSDEIRLSEYLKRAGYVLLHTVGYGTPEQALSGTQLFIAQRRKNTAESDTVVVAFRGTEPDDFYDLKTNLNMLRVPWNNASGLQLGQVHGGFANALLQGNNQGNILLTLVHQLRITFPPNTRILFTGHSLGAALATLAAAYLMDDALAENLQLYTFGSPLVGDSAFVSAVAAIDHVRYVDCTDLVTRVPPESLGFKHAGSQRYIDRNGQVLLEPGVELIAKDRKLASAQYLAKYTRLPETVAVRKLADHSPINYVAAVSGLIPCIALNPAVDAAAVLAREKSLIDDLRANLPISDYCADGFWGLGFSGGGIRSATFNLGILQAFAKQGLLRKVDYLSTVSGGGYIGSWLSALILRKRQQLEARNPGRMDSDNLDDAIEKLSYARNRKLAEIDDLKVLADIETRTGEINKLDAEIQSLKTKRLSLQQVALIEVENDLAQRPVLNANSTGRNVEKTEESAAIHFLRSYSNYLTPKAGLFSSDTLAAVANLLKNVYLNQTILIALLIAALLLPRLLYAFFSWISPSLSTESGQIVPWLAASGLAILAYVIYFSTTQLGKWPLSRQSTASGISLYLLLPGFIAAMLLSYALNAAAHSDAFSSTWSSQLALQFTLVSGLAYGLVYLVVNTALRIRTLIPWLKNTQEPALFRRLTTATRAKFVEFDLAEYLVTVLAPFAAGALAGYLGYLLYLLFGQVDPIHGRWLALGLGTALVLKILSLMLVLHIGLVSRGFTEESREWWGRLGGMGLWLCFIWVGLFAIAIYGPIGVVWAGNWMVSVGGATWLLSTAAGIWLGRSPATGRRNSISLLDKVLSITPYVFIVGLLIILSYGIDRLNHGITAARVQITELSINPQVNIKVPLGTETQFINAKGESIATQASADATMQLTMPDVYARARMYLPGELNFVRLADIGLNRMHEVDPQRLLMEFMAGFAVFVLLGWRVDVNLFSMHHFYCNRLARCYLGASNASRRPSPFTGLDSNDDVDLVNCTHRPYPIINTAINLVSSDELAWQQRKAGSFVFTPAYSGYELKENKGNVLGFRKTREYMSGTGYENGVKLAMAFAISGAAASPNMGYHSSPGLAILMTLFNVRLGRWCGNPADRAIKSDWFTRMGYSLAAPFRSHKPGDEWRSLSPAFGGKYLISELLGQTNENSAFVYLSDGGHFENLGLYELVRRECKLIVICDAAADGATAFEDLGNAIRKCYTDFGAHVDIDPAPLHLMPESRFSYRHWQKGEITYRNGNKATLFYLKASLTAEVPAAVLQYANQETSFPHQSTADQWFEESQFESYRALGEYIGGLAAIEIGKEFRPETAYPVN